jgi:hypothetical protein
MSTRTTLPTVDPMTGSAHPVATNGSTKLSLLYPTRDYHVTRNPFAIAAVLPLLVAAFIGLDLAVLAGVDQVVACGAFLVVTTGLLAISATTLRGSLVMNHDGITFHRGKEHFTASWDDVTGITYRQGAGLCLEMTGVQQSVPKMRAPGGFSGVNGVVSLPLRLFGDRQHAMLYDIRDRLPSTAIDDAVKQASTWTTKRCLIAYAGVTAIVIGAIAATAIAFS